jgi:hypothetical protein
MKRERGSTIERVLDILDIVAASTKPLSATEINEALNLPKASPGQLSFRRLTPRHIDRTVGKGR